MWHDRVDFECIKSEAEPECWEFGDLHYQFVGVAAAAGASWLAGMVLKRAVKLPFGSCTWNFSRDKMTTERMSTQHQKRVHGRWVHEWFHAAFCVVAFFFWKYIDENENDPAEQPRVANWLMQLPVLRLWFQAFMTVVPTISAEAMGNHRDEDHIALKWVKNNAPWAFASIALKALLFVATDFIVSPESTLLWDKADDSTSQRNIVIAVVLVAGLAILYFWKRFNQVCGGDCGAQPKFACVDFPIFLVITAQLAWNVTARLDNQHDTPTVSFDFLSQVLYAYLVFFGILNIPVAEDGYDVLEKDENAADSGESGP